MHPTPQHLWSQVGLAEELGLLPAAGRPQFSQLLFSGNETQTSFSNASRRSTERVPGATAAQTPRVLPSGSGQGCAAPRAWPVPGSVGESDAAPSAARGGSLRW